jgi:tetratricopeptide (TPR) repeat protein
VCRSPAGAALLQSLQLVDGVDVSSLMAVSLSYTTVYREVARRARLSFVLFLLASSPASAQSLTFNKDIAPIVFARCAPCHRPGEIAPFSLLTYADVKQRATLVADVTARRVMPPWKPRPDGEALLDSRALSQTELDKIQQWVKLGAFEGDPRDLPALPQWDTGWQLGTPDLVVSMDQPFTLTASGVDVFRTFVLHIPTTTPRFVRAIEFRPGNARAVHHANIGVDRTRSSARLDQEDAEPGYEGGMVPDAAYPPGYMLGWTPGQRPRPSPDGTAWRLERASDLVVQLHMQPTGKPETVQVSAAFYFTSEPPVRTPVGLRLGSETIDIAPGDTQYAVSDSYVLPVDADLLAIQPHAHNLARQMTAVAAFPNGTTRSLITIDDWDFRWQDVYRYAQPVLLPKGSTIRMRFVYDNSAANPRNPHQPPARVVWGQNTTDEMGDLWLQLVPRSNADLPVLSADVERKRAREDLAAYTKLLKQDPDNPLRHDAVGLLYLQGGRGPEAVAEFRASLALNPESAPTAYNLGLALSLIRQYQQAAAAFREAIRLAPDYAEAHNNLGAMLHTFGQLDEAAVQYRLAATLRPDNAEAENNLGRVLLQQRKASEAIGHFERAIDLNPNLASALSGLAWIRATSPPPARNGAEAVRLAERADQLTGHQDASVLDALAAAYASAGAFDRAVTTARAAVAAAGPAGLPELEAEIRTRITLYEQKEAVVINP